MANPMEAMQASPQVADQQPHGLMARLHGESGLTTPGKIIAGGVLLVSALLLKEPVMNMADGGSDTAASASLFGDAVGSRAGDTTSDSNDDGSDTVDSNCQESEFENVAADTEKYNPGTFLPHTNTLTDADGVSSYVRSLFNGNGPLAQKIDKGSLAALTALLGQPSHDGVATNPSYSYKAAFNERFARYSSNVGNPLADAKKDCEALHETMVKTGQYDESFAEAGETVVESIALVDENNNRVDMNLEEVVTGSTISGVTFELRTSAHGLDGFVAVAVNPEGRIFLKGLTPDQLGSTKEAEGDSGTNPANGSAGVNPANPGNTGVNPNGGGGPRNGNNQGNTNTGGAAGPNGTNPEAGPNGVTPSPANGGTTVDTVPRGGGDNAPGSTTTTQPERPTPTTQPESTTTTQPKRVIGYWKSRI